MNVPIESFGDTNISVSQEKAKMFDEMIGLLVSKLQEVNSTKLKIQIMTLIPTDWTIKKIFRNISSVQIHN